MVQVSYPGIYIEEFTPPSPIEGVGTSTVAFIGTAAMGPVRKPTRLHSWDAFQSTFGDFLSEQPPSYLAPAVYGFFLNGGTDCFIVRASTAKHASANLLSRHTGSTEAVLVADAIPEGPAGNAVTVTVSNSSYLADALGAAGPTLAVHRAKSNLGAALPTGAGADRHTITVQSNTDFRVGERVVVETSNTTSGEAIVAKVEVAQTVVLATNVAGSATFNNGWLRSADLVPGQREILVDVPSGVNLARAVPLGSTVAVATTTAKTDIRTVDHAGDGTAGPTVFLTEGLVSTWDLNANTLPTVASLEFDLVVMQAGATSQETFSRLSMNPDHPNYWGSAVSSAFVTLAPPTAPPASPSPDPRPLAQAYPLAGGQPDDRATAWAAVQSDPTSLLELLTPYGEVDIVCIPGATSQTAQQAIGNYCLNLRNRFAILDSQFGLLPGNGINDQVDGLRFDDGFAALYYPWILALNPKTNRTEYWPPSGHVAGIYARTDQRGVHVAPANATIRGALGLELRLSDLDQGPLNLYGINVLRVFPGQSTPVVWGARTTYMQNKYWQYVSIRRLFIYLEQSIEQGIRWAVFQPNDLTLWQQLKRAIGDFLTKAWQDGALFGAKPSDAFYVRIDEALNPESEQALGRLHIEIGVRPSYPAEFIVIRIGIWQGGSAVSEG